MRFFTSRKAQRITPSPRRPRSRRLVLEWLEERVVPTIPDGTILVTTSHSAFSSVPQDSYPIGIIGVNPSTGQQFPISTGGLFALPTYVVEAPDQQLYVTDLQANATGEVIRVDTNGGQHLVATRGFLNGPNALAYINGFLYVANTGDGSGAVHSIVRVDPNSGLQTLISNGDNDTVHGSTLNSDSSTSTGGNSATTLNDVSSHTIGVSSTSTGNNTTSAVLNDTTQNWLASQWAGWKVTITGGTGAGQVQTIVGNTPNQLYLANPWSTNPDSSSTYVITRWTPDDWAGYTVQITSGTGAGQTRTITGNSATQLTVSTAWDTVPDASSTYKIGTVTTLNDTFKSWTTNQWVGWTVRISNGKGLGQQATVLSNSATQLIVSGSWATVPDSSSRFEIGFSVPTGMTAYNGNLLVTNEPGGSGGADPGGVVMVNITTGVQTTVTHGGYLVHASDIAPDPSGNLITMGATSPTDYVGSIVRTNPNTGVQTQVSHDGILYYLDGMTVDLSTGEIYTGAISTGFIPAAMYAVDPVSGAQSQIAQGGLMSLVEGIRVFHGTVQTASTTSVSSSANPSFPGQSVTFTATVMPQGGGTPTGTVQFKVDNSNAGGPVNVTTSNGVTTASFSTTTLTVAGSPHTIAATYSGDGTFSGSTGSVSQFVNSSNTVIGSNFNPSVFGQTIIVTATVTGLGSGTVTGTVQFALNGTNIGTPQSVTTSGSTATASFTTNGLPASSSAYTISASYSGNGSFPSSGGSFNQTVNKASTSTTVSSTPNPATAGQPVMFTATVNVTSPGSGTPSGIVQFMEGSSTLGQGTLTSSGGAPTATFTTSSLGVGGHTITANYTSDSNFSGSSGAVNESITSAVNTSSTVVGSSVTPASVFGQSVTFTATVTGNGPGTPTGTVQFAVDNSPVGGPMNVTTTNGVTTASCTTTTLTASGSPHTISASYSGDGSFAPSSGSFSQTVNPAATSTTLSAATAQNPSVTSSVYGQAVTFTATIMVTGNGAGTPTGTVQFLVDNSNVGGPVNVTTSNGVTSASFTTSSLTVAGSPHTITANYTDNGNFANSSGSFSQTITQASTSTALNSSANPATVGQSVTFTATVSAVSPGVGSPSGTVQFKVDNSNAGGPVNVTTSNGVTTASFTTSSLTVAGSPHTIAATYSGDGNFTGSNGSLLETIANLRVSTTTVHSSANPSAFGQSVSFTATVTPQSGSGTPSGTVQFMIDGSNFGNPVTLSGGTAASQATSGLTVAGSPHTISVSYSGDATFAGGTASLNGGQVVNQATTSTTVKSSVNPSVPNQAVTFTATIAVTGNGAGAPSGTVQFAVDNSNTGGPVSVTTSNGVTTASFTTSSLTLAGSPHTIAATYSGDGNFTGSNGSVSQTVSQSTLTIADGTILALTIHSGGPTGIIGVNPTTGAQTVISVGGFFALPEAIKQGANGVLYVADFAAGGTGAILAFNPGTGQQSVVAIGGFINGPNGLAIVNGLLYVADGGGNNGPNLVEVNPSNGQQRLVSSGGNFTSPAGLAAASSTSVYWADEFAFGLSAIFQVNVQSGAQNLVSQGGFINHLVDVSVDASGNILAINGGSTGSVIRINPVNGGQGRLSYGNLLTGLDGGTVDVNHGGTIFVSSLGNPSKIVAVDPRIGSQRTVSSDNYLSGVTGLTVFTNSQTTSSSSTVVSASANPSVTGQSVTFTATVTGNGPGTPTGTVQFAVDNANVGSPMNVTTTNGVTTASYTTTTLTASGSPHTISASYSGDGSFAPSSGSFSQTVNPAATSTTLSAATAQNPSVTSSVYGQAVTFTATIMVTGNGAGTPTGTVQFLVDNSNVGGPVSVTTSNGVTSASFTTSSLTVAGSPHTIAANYSGDANFTSSPSSPFSFTINKASTGTAVTSSANPSPAGQSVTFTATVSAVSPGVGSPSGTVQFKVDNSNAGGPVNVTTSNGVTTASFTTSSLTVAGSPHTIAATYSGDGNFTGSNGSLLETIANLRVSTTTVHSSVNPSAFGQSVSFTATVTPQSGSGTPSGTVQFMIDGSNFGNPVTLSGGTAASQATSGLTVAGSPHTISVSYSGDATFAGGTASLNGGQVVNQATTSTTVKSSVNPSAPNQAVTFTATIAVTGNGAGAPSGTVQFAVDNSNTGGPVSVTTSNGVTTASFTTSSLTLAGSPHTIAATYSGDGNFTGSNGSVSQTVSQSTLTIADGTILALTIHSGGPTGIIGINPTTGAQTVISVGGFFAFPEAIKQGANGVLYVADFAAGGTGAILAFNPGTGQQSVVAFGGFINGPNGLAIVNGLLYVADGGGNNGPNLVEVNPSNGQQRLVSSGGNFTSPAGLAAASSNSVYWADEFAFGSGAIFQVNVQSGAQNLVSQGGLINHLVDVSVDASGNIYAINGGSTGSVIRINPVTGAQGRLSFGNLLTNLNGGTVDVNHGGTIFVSSLGNPSKIVAVDPRIGSQRTVSSDNNLIGVTGLTVYTVGGGGAAGSARSPATGDSPTLAANFNTFLTNSTALASPGSSLLRSASPQVPLVAVSSQSPVPSTNGNVAGFTLRSAFSGQARMTRDAADSFFANWESTRTEGELGPALPG